MKIGMITIHESFSLGASLQACALGLLLKRLGHKPEIIDYKPAYMTSIYDRPKMNAKTLARYLILGRVIKRKTERFRRFKKMYHPAMTHRVIEKAELGHFQDEYDAFICGSDQIWNPPHMHYDGVFFLNFVSKGKAKRISYAPSIGMDVLAERDCDFIKENIQFIDYASAREDSAVALLRELTDRPDIEQVLDPTLLIETSKWREMQRPVPQHLPKRFILYYPLFPHPQADSIIDRVKEKVKLPCVCLSGGLRKPHGADIVLRDIGPQEMLYLYDRADIVVTNSFHGVAFSINYQRKMIVYPHTERNCRMESMLRLFQIENYQISSVKEFDAWEWDTLWATGIENISTVLQREKERSYNFLKGALNNDHSECY